MAEWRRDYNQVRPH
ncbi:hypothetical protein, partial [Pseudomonas aeruginosa]